VGKLEIVVLESVKSCESRGDVRLEAQTCKLNEDCPTPTYKRLQGSEDKYSGM
jgi:hypothetical protein